MNDLSKDGISMKSWLLLGRMALDDVHPGWIADIEPELVEKARHSAFGRRFLANKLSKKFMLFSQLPYDYKNGADVTNETWLFTSLSKQSTCLLELGAKSCLDVLRAEVSRENVLRLRRVLTDDSYERLLQQSNPIAPKRAQYDENFDLVETDDDLFQRLLCNAAIEIYVYALKIHPLAAERVLLSFPSEWSLVGVNARLSYDYMASFLPELCTKNDLQQE